MVYCIYMAKPPDVTLQTQGRDMARPRILKCSNPARSCKGNKPVSFLQKAPVNCLEAGARSCEDLGFRCQNSSAGASAEN